MILISLLYDMNDQTVRERDCQFGVSPVNYSDSDSDSDSRFHVVSGIKLCGFGL